MSFSRLRNTIFTLVILGAAWLAAPSLHACQEIASELVDDIFPQPSAVLEKSQGEGHFIVGNEGKLRSTTERYLKDKEAGLEVDVPGEVNRVAGKDLVADLDRMARQDIEQVRQRGLSSLAADFVTAKGRSARDKILAVGYEGFSRLHYLTSGAGLWSRGGGQIKALIPVNMKNLVSAVKFERLSKAGDIVAAKTPEDTIKKAGEEVPSSESAINARANALRDRAKEEINDVVTEAREHPDAVNVLDLKLAQMAMLSAKSGQFIHFDIWTSEQTHSGINNHLQLFRQRYKQMKFHPDAAVNKDIINAVERYLKAADTLGETFLFGYQEGIYPLDPATGKPITDQVPIGEGAGMAPHYLHESGRANQLGHRGVKDWVFQNIEVVSDLAVEYGAYKASEQAVGVVVVPTSDGYSGGAPYRVASPEGDRYMLLEGSAVPKELEAGNPYFNTNTIFQRYDIVRPTNIGYEKKDGGTIIRLKMNAGDVTFDNGTALIGGRIFKRPISYRNFKSYGEYGDNALDMLNAVQQDYAMYR